MFQFVSGIFIADNDGMGVLLQVADGPHMVDWLFYAMTEGMGFIVATLHNHHLLSIHHCADTNRQSCLLYQINIILKKRLLAITVSVVRVFWRVRL